MANIAPRGIGRRFLLVVCLGSWIAAPALAAGGEQAPGSQRPPVQAPPDVKPMSPTLEDVPYPHIEAPDRFYAALLKFLKADAPTSAQKAGAGQ